MTSNWLPCEHPVNEHCVCSCSYVHNIYLYNSWIIIMQIQKSYYAPVLKVLCVFYAFTTICIPRLHVDKEIKNIEPLYMKR